MDILKIVETNELTPYNASNYQKEKNLSFTMLFNHIYYKLIEICKAENKDFKNYLSFYIILYKEIEEFNDCSLSERERAKKYFNCYNTLSNKILDDLERWGFIYQEKKKFKKKIIIMKYPEFMEEREKMYITYTKETYIKEVYTKEVAKDSKEQINVNINLKDNDYLDGYISWWNRDERRKPILNPAGFKNKYRKNPALYDFSEYEQYLNSTRIRHERNAQVLEEIEEHRKQAKLHDLEYHKQLKELTELKEKEPEFFNTMLRDMLAKNPAYYIYFNSMRKDYTFRPVTLALYNFWKNS